ncbi:MAG: hypothetical protein AABW73_04105 [Nanoarchaeota archaeon]
MINKKAEIGATIAWIPAIFVIAIIISVYVVLATGERAKLGQVQYELLTSSENLKDTVILQSLSTLIINGKLFDAELIKKICKNYDLRFLELGKDYSQDAENQRLDMNLKRKIDLVYYGSGEQKRVVFREGIRC